MAAEHLQRAAHGRRRRRRRAVDEAVHERGHVAAPAVGDGERADRCYQSALAYFGCWWELAPPARALRPPYEMEAEEAETKQRVEAHRLPQAKLVRDELVGEQHGPAPQRARVRGVRREHNSSLPGGAPAARFV